MTFLKRTIFILLLLPACKQELPVNTEAEIENTETAFMQACKEKGIGEAFYLFADSTAIIKRENDTLISGPEAIRNYYSRPFYSTAEVAWKPVHIDVSASRDMAYSYGKYNWIFTDSAGTKSEYSGVYMTIWKKQKDQTWKYVWD